MTALLFCLMLIRIVFTGYPADPNAPVQVPARETVPGFSFNDLFPGGRVYLFSPSMDMEKVQLVLDSIYALQSGRGSEFSLNRFALLFEPGTYPLDVRVGYYMQVMGLGEHPGDVVIEGAVRSNSRRGRGNVLTNFWRSMENLSVVPAGDSADVWGVSQAAPMRRVHIRGDLQLHDNGFASGGFMADTKVDGMVEAGGQQQWFSRNCEWGEWRRGAWNIFSMGVTGARPTDWPEGIYTTLEEVPESREKPYLVKTEEGLVMRIPGTRRNSSGISWNETYHGGRDLPLKDMYFVIPGRDSAGSINRALSDGKDLLFMPGIYSLDHCLEVSRPGTVITGLGMPSLVPQNGEPALCVNAAAGTIISGLLFDAGPELSETLLRVGRKGDRQDHPEDPCWLFDLFFRVGGPSEGSVTSCAEIDGNDVFIDHTWFWRADHGNGVGWDQNRSRHGIVVNGDRVTVYGLFNEHHQGYQTLWNGENGRVYLYQSEMPYDPPSVEAWMNGDKGGFASYKVADHVRSHQAWGVGVYCVFHNAPVVVETAIETPESLEDSIRHKFTFFLGGYENSMIKSVINGKGDPVYGGHRKSVME